MSEINFNPYIEDSGPITTQEVDRHIGTIDLPIAYYGEVPEGVTAVKRRHHSSIEVEDDSGKTKYSVLISGDLSQAKKVLIKAMSWSEHPGRGFEGLREALIASPEDKLAVVGVSFPGAGLNSEGMTEKQKESLKAETGDFSFIADQQWQAILKALRTELVNEGLSGADAEAKIRGFEVTLAGSSQGASNSVGLLQSAPEFINIAGLGLIQNTGWERSGPIGFRMNFIKHGSEHFKDYTSVNPYNEYPALGPGHNTFKNAVRNPSSHFGAVVSAMRRGGDVSRILMSIHEQDRKDLMAVIAGASEDKLSRPEANRRAVAALNASELVLSKAIIWPEHFHPVMENLGNAQTAFRKVVQ